MLKTSAVVVLGFAAEALAVRSQAARAVEISAPARVESQAKIQAETPARDTTQTDAFRRHVAGRNRERSAVMGPVTISFEVGADGRPRDVRIVESPTPELGEFARSLLDDGPDWPAEPSHKLITLNL